MGMFDYVKCEMELPTTKFETIPKDSLFQTKSMMDESSGHLWYYKITESGKILRSIEHIQGKDKYVEFDGEELPSTYLYFYGEDLDFVAILNKGKVEKIFRLKCR